MEPLLEEVLFFSFIYLFCFLGALSKDVLDTYLGKIEEILMIKIIVSSLAVSILVYGASDKLLEKLTYKPFTALCYTMGLVSFEVLVRYSDVKSIGGFIEEVYRIQYSKDKGKR